VYFNKARNNKQAQAFYEELQKIRGVQYNSVEKRDCEYFSRWYYAAVRNVLDLAKRSLRTHPKDLRNVSTMTMNISAANFMEIQDLIGDFQNNVAQIVEASDTSDRVYQLNIQLFPLSIVPEHITLFGGDD
jgi:hypothetical protein